MKVEFHPNTAEEFVETVTFYEHEVSGLGEGFILEVEKVVELVQSHPHIGKKITEQFQ